MLNYPHRPGFKEKFFFFLSGAIISVPFPALANSLLRNLMLYSLSPYRINIISIAFLAPLFEEFAKAYPLYYRHGETERSVMTLGFLSGLGFGVLEFLLYVFILDAPPEARVFLVLFHASNTTIVARGIGRHHPFIYFAIAVLLHGFYNSFIQENSLLAFLPLIASYILAAAFYTLSHESYYEPKLLTKENYK